MDGPDPGPPEEDRLNRARAYWNNCGVNSFKYSRQLIHV